MKATYCLILMLTISGCASARLVRETPNGGHVQVTGGGSQAEPGKKKAEEVMSKKCPAGWEVTQSGVENTGTLIGAGYGTQVAAEAYFVDFKCK